MMSDARVKCVPSTMIIGVGCGKSYSISNPTRIFIRKCHPVYPFQMATKPQETRRDCLIRSIAFHLAESDGYLPGKSAHRERCPKTSNASRHDELVNSRDYAIATGNRSLQAFFPHQGYRSAAAARPL